MHLWFRSWLIGGLLGFFFVPMLAPSTQMGAAAVYGVGLGVLLGSAIAGSVSGMRWCAGHWRVTGVAAVTVAALLLVGRYLGS